MTDQLLKLVTRCKNSISIEVNGHRDYYQSAQDSIDEYLRTNSTTIDEIGDTDVVNEMIKTNTIVMIHFYPDTAIGSYTVWHYDLKMALDIAIKTLDEHDKR